MTVSSSPAGRGRIVYVLGVRAEAHEFRTGLLDCAAEFVPSSDGAKQLDIQHNTCSNSTHKQECLTLQGGTTL